MVISCKQRLITKEFKFYVLVIKSFCKNLNYYCNTVSQSSFKYFPIISQSHEVKDESSPIAFQFLYMTLVIDIIDGCDLRLRVLCI